MFPAAGAVTGPPGGGFRDEGRSNPTGQSHAPGKNTVRPGADRAQLPDLQSRRAGGLGPGRPRLAAPSPPRPGATITSLVGQAHQAACRVRPGIPVRTIQAKAVGLGFELDVDAVPGSELKNAERRCSRTFSDAGAACEYWTARS